MQSIVIEAPITRVWSEVTKLGELNRALMDSILDTTLEPGAPVRYRTADGKRIVIVGRILEVDPPTRLVMRWQLTMRDDAASLVTWSLEEESGGTRVTVTHNGFAEGTKLKGYDKTWVQMLANLKRVIETGDLDALTKLQYMVMGWFTFAMPSRTKPEKVTIPD